MLNDLVVIELASVLAGPDVGMFFSELGAKVIKVENTLTNGDVTRTWKLPSENEKNNVSAYFSSVNWHKEYLQLNLKQEVEQNKIHELVKKAHVVIANFKKGDDVKLRMDYKTLKKINSNLIYGAITGFGSNSSRVAFDVVLQAETGFMSMNGTKQSGPLKMPVALIDVLAAHQLKQGLLLALLKQQKTNKSYYVEVSLFDAAISALKNQASNWLMNNHIPEALGSLHPNIAPYGEVFTTKDNKQIVLAIGSNVQFISLLNLVGAEKIKKSTKFKTNALRVKNRILLEKELSPFFKNYNRNELMKLLIGNNIPSGAIKNLKEVFEDTATQNLINEENIDGVYTKRVKTAIFKIS